jgi:hypothetical protein
MALQKSVCDGQTACSEESFVRGVRPRTREIIVF